jgi:chorismate dehydratase
MRAFRFRAAHNLRGTFMQPHATSAQPLHRLGVVSFLNARPLIEGLDYSHGVSLVYDVPARLPGLLDAGQVDAALVPIIDIVRPHRRWQIISDACIGCDGETLTVRIFSRVPPDEIRRLHVDGDSHTSVALASVIWQEMFGCRLQIIPLDSTGGDLSRVEAVLLIGDKVVNHRLTEFDIETDLGGAWKSLTGLPFVFAAWVCGQGYPAGDLPRVLSAARDLGVSRAAQIAANAGPGLGWPVELATRYLTHRLKFRMTDKHREALSVFFELVQQQQLLPEVQGLVFA